MGKIQRKRKVRKEEKKKSKKGRENLKEKKVIALISRDPGVLCVCVI